MLFSKLVNKKSIDVCSKWQGSELGSEQPAEEEGSEQQQPEEEEEEDDEGKVPLSNRNWLSVGRPGRSKKKDDEEEEEAAKKSGGSKGGGRKGKKKVPKLKIKLGAARRAAVTMRKMATACHLCCLDPELNERRRKSGAARTARNYLFSL